MKSQIETLLRQAKQLPAGHAKTDLTREAVHLADTLRDLDLQFSSRLDHVSAAMFSGQIAESIVAYTWLLNHREEYGDRRDDTLLWSYKWIIDSVIEIADFSKAQVDHFIADCFPDGIDIDRSSAMICLQSSSDATGGCYAHVRANQPRFEVLQQSVVENLPGAKQVANVGPQNLLRLFEPTF